MSDYELTRLTMKGGGGEITFIMEAEADARVDKERVRTDAACADASKIYIESVERAKGLRAERDAAEMKAARLAVRVAELEKVSRIMLHRLRKVYTHTRDESTPGFVIHERELNMWDELVERPAKVDVLDTNGTDPSLINYAVELFTRGVSVETLAVRANRSCEEVQGWLDAAGVESR